VALLDRAIVRLLPAVPRPIVQKLSERYIAGPELKDARATVRRLNAEGKLATIDVLGEEIANEEDAAAIVDAYEDVFADIERCNLESNVSVKPTALGLKLDLDLCRANLRAVVADAAARDNFVRIDMEDSSTTDDTLRLYRELREEGHENLGIVLQATLRRTLADIRALADLQPSVRLCKGIYIEPEDIAYREFEAVRSNFVRALEALLETGSYVGIATHDGWLLERGRELVEEAGLAADEYEFQMLLGVREELGNDLVEEGRRLRIYVPFGRHWYEYSLRRLQENPRIAGYIAADTLGRFLPTHNGAQGPPLRCVRAGRLVISDGRAGRARTS
jgi:proline dehydrogenase